VVRRGRRLVAAGRRVDQDVIRRSARTVVALVRRRARKGAARAVTGARVAIRRAAHRDAVLLRRPFRVFDERLVARRARARIDVALHGAWRRVAGLDRVGAWRAVDARRVDDRRAREHRGGARLKVWREAGAAARRVAGAARLRARRAEKVVVVEWIAARLAEA